MKSAKSVSAIAALVASAFTLEAQAVLNAVDPGPYVDANGGFPVWYQDSKGVGLDLCLSQATLAAGAVPGGVGGAACVLGAEPDVFDPALPIVFPATAGACPNTDRTLCNFPGESFWFMGDATFTAGGVEVIYVANLEAAFVTEIPARGGQISFARIRMRISLPAGSPAGNYTVTHPYGKDVFNVTAGGDRVINATGDVGVAPGLFTGALAGRIGPFLMDASVPANGFIASSVPGEFYVGDPNTPRPVVGSPFGTNFVRVDGPAGFTPVESNLFNVMGKVHTGALATPLLIERTTYARRSDAGGNVTAQQDVFVTAPPAPTHVVSATDANGAAVTMTDNDSDGGWYGQSAGNPAGGSVAVTAAPTPASGLSNTPTTASKALTDLVTIKRAEYSLSAHTLIVEAASSDEVPLPVLTVNGQSLVPTGVDALQSVTLGGLAIPPATVTVTSAKGGSDTELVLLVP